MVERQLHLPVEQTPFGATEVRVLLRAPVLWYNGFMLEYARRVDVEGISDASSILAGSTKVLML